MAIEKVIDIKVQGNAEQAVGSLRSQLREAQAEVAALSDKFGATSAEAVKAAQKAAELKDKIGDAKALTDAFNPDAKFKALTSSLAGVAGGFAAVQGGMALFGGQSKEVEATLLKVQSAMALSQGIQAVGESIDSFKQLGAVVKSYSIVQKVLTAGQWLWNAAQAASPIGAIILAITALIAAGVALVNYFKESAKEAAAQTKAVNENAKALDNQAKAAERANAVFEKKQQFDLDMAKASGKNKDAIQALESKLIDEKVAFEESARATAMSTVEKNKNYLATLKAADADEELIKKQQETTNKSIEEYNKQNKNVQAAYDERTAIKRKHIVEDIQSSTDQGKTLLQTQKELNQKLAEEQYAARQKDADDLAAFNKKKIEDNQNQWDTLYNSQKDAQQLLNESTMTQQEIELAAIDKKYQDQIALATKLGQDTTVLTDAFALERTGIMQKYATEEDRIKAEQKAKDEEIAAANILLAEKEAAAKQALIGKTADVLSKGADLLGKNTAASKAMSIAAATINTYQGITAELATKTVTPFEIGLKIANVAIIAATGFKAVKDIISVKVPGGGGGGAAPSMGAMGGATAPQFNVVGSTGVNQLAGVMGAQQQTPVQAYVVANNVTTAQGLDRNIIQSATLGG